MIILLVLMYINRALFVSAAYEMESQKGGELNSLVEWLIQWATGQGNDIDEDGDLQTNGSFAKIFHHDFPQQCIQIDVLSKDIPKTGFPNRANLFLNGFCSQIDQPPEAMV